MEPTTLLLAGLILLASTVVVTFVTVRFPKTRPVLIPLIWLFATVGISCNIMSIVINLQRMY